VSVPGSVRPPASPITAAWASPEATRVSAVAASARRTCRRPGSARAKAGHPGGDYVHERALSAGQDRRPGALTVQLRPERLLGVEHGPRVGQQRLAGRRQRQRAPLASVERRVQGLGETAHDGEQRRLRQVHLRGAVREGALRRERHEGPQVVRVHAAHRGPEITFIDSSYQQSSGLPSACGYVGGRNPLPERTDVRPPDFDTSCEHGRRRALAQ
jgi:hypothetical protein